MTPLRVSRGRRDSQSCGNLRINLRNSSADHRKGGGSGRRPAEAERGSPPSPWAALPVPIPCASVPPPTTGAQLGNLPCPSSRPCSATPPALAGSTPSSQARPHIPLRPRSSSTLETCIARPFPGFHTVTRTSEAPGKKKKKKRAWSGRDGRRVRGLRRGPGAKVSPRRHAMRSGVPGLAFAGGRARQVQSQKYSRSRTAQGQDAFRKLRGCLRRSRSCADIPECARTARCAPLSCTPGRPVAVPKSLCLNRARQERTRPQRTRNASPAA